MPIGHPHVFFEEISVQFLFKISVQFNLKPIFKLGSGECFAVELYEFPILYINPTSLMAQW